MSMVGTRMPVNMLFLWGGWWWFMSISLCENCVCVNYVRLSETYVSGRGRGFITIGR